MLQQHLLERLCSLPPPNVQLGPQNQGVLCEASADCQQVIYLVGSEPLLESQSLRLSQIQSP